LRSISVSRSDLESLLGSISRPPTDPRAGVFGPDSMFWKVSRESALFLAAGRAALLQLAHPWVAAAIAEHSTVLGAPITRFHNTFRIVFTVVFGSLDQALAAARSLHALHTGIRGKLPEGVGSWTQGSHYEANELAALRWVHATLIESAVLAWECVLPVTPDEREQYYQESKTLAAFFGIPAGALPGDWAEFAEYNREMGGSPVLGVSESARSIGQGILRGAGSWIRPPRWYRALTASWLPRRFRDEFGISFASADQRAAARARRRLPRVYPLLPPALRFVGPYREAQARLRNRLPGRLTQWSNRFWIGQPLTPFRDEL
jgi:uncharacterized protein (DUF2236 family)